MLRAGDAMNSTHTNALAACIAFIVAFINCVDEKSRVWTYVIPILRTITLYVIVASACGYDAQCAHLNRRELQHWLLGNLFGSGFAQDVALYWMFLQPRAREDHYAWNRWVVPLAWMALSIAVVYFALEPMIEGDYVYVGAIIGTVINAVFFYYYVYIAKKIHSGQNAIDIAMRRFARDVLIGISVSNVWANWIMYALSWAPANRAQWSFPTVTCVVVFCGAIAFLKVRGELNAPKCGKALPWRDVLQNGIAPALSAFGYVLGVGEALSASGVRLSVTISIIPYVFVIVIPAYGLMRKTRDADVGLPGTHQSQAQQSPQPLLRL